MGNVSRTREIGDYLKKYATWSFVKSLVVDPARLPLVGVLIVAAEVVLNILIVQRVPYTEIDWKAYMQECEGFLNGTLDYSQLRGDTGPLVYPAGFVYLYSALYYLTDYGENVRRAQYVFGLIYVLQLLAVLRVYIKSRKVPPYVLALSILTSYRIHSIYVLRLFNDPIAVLLFYISLNLFLDSRWHLASLFYSFAVSVKMNILLYAPVLLLFYLYNLGLKRTTVQLGLCAVVQLLLGLPFLLHSPAEYMRGSFDVGRVFNHTWTVNYRFLPVDIFESRCFHLTLLVVHVALLLLFLPLFNKFFSTYSRLRGLQGSMQQQIDTKNREIKQRKVKERKRKTVGREEGKLTADQESFLKSFESSLHKSTGGAAPARLAQTSELYDSEETFYSVNFDSLSQLVLLPLLMANLIGVACARSLHYQFYSWYFHSLPYLLWSGSLSVPVRLLLLALLELCWNTYPSTDLTSALLHVCHAAILYGIYQKHSGQMKLASKV